MADPEITFIVEHEVQPDRAREFSDLVPVLEKAANEDPGTVEYRWYAEASSSAMCLYERYRDSEATIKHIQAFGQELAKRYEDLIKVKSVVMLGPASDELAAMLAPFFEGSVPGVSAVWYRTADDVDGTANG